MDLRRWLYSEIKLQKNDETSESAEDQNEADIEQVKILLNIINVRLIW